MAEADRYVKLGPKEDVEKTRRALGADSKLADLNFEFIVFRERNDIPDTEAIFYYIRNAFAHGSFEIKETGGNSVFLLESRKANSVKAQMRLKEKTLRYYRELAAMSCSKNKSLKFGSK